MLKNLLYLFDGTCISSGTGQAVAVQSCTITDCVNSGEELTLGSTCCSCLEVKIFAPDGELNIPVGKEVRLCKVQDGGEPVQAGVFLPEHPAKVNAGIYKLTAYDKVSLFDKDLSSWLKSLTGWPYSLLTFAGMVCKACGLTLATTEIPNGSFPVQQFFKSGVTGRQLMRWIGEIAGRFCRANADGDITFGWYTSSGVTIRPTGDRYYFGGALTYDDYDVAPIDAVKLRLADSDSGALWPNGAAANPYVITGNAILLARVTNDLKPYLKTIQGQLAALPAYKPCKVSLPAGMDIRAGQTVQVVDKHGNAFTTLVMTKTQRGQRDELECTGSPRRDSSSAVNNKSAAQLGAEQEAYSQNAAQQAVENQSWESLFNKWTNGGNIQGIFAQDGVWIFNAAVGKISNLIADMITAGKLKSTDGKTYFDLDKGVFRSIGDSTITEIGNGNLRILNLDEAPIIELLGENSGGRLVLYDQNADLSFELKARSQRTSITCWNHDAQSTSGGWLGIKEINGANVLALGPF